MSRSARRRARVAPSQCAARGFARSPAAVLLLAAALFVAACGSPVPTPGPTSTPTPPATPTPSPRPTPPPGSTMVEVPEAGIMLPVPDGWERVDGGALADPAVRERLAATYSGTERLLGSIDALEGRAEPVFLAADPSPASLSGPLAANLSVMVSQPSVGGFLLDFAAGFIEDGLTEVLGAAEEPARDRVDLAAGEAVRFSYSLPASDGEEIVAVAWVVGAPSGTLLVTLIGTATALGALDPDAIAGAILPIEGGIP